MMPPFRWGILGTARINRRVVPGIKRAGHAIAIVGSRDPQKGQAAAAEYGAERAGTYDDVLNARDVDAVYISLPNGLHLPWTLRAAEAGKHVLCEKPMATTPADCATMIGACERAGVHLVEAFMYRYHPQWDIVWNALNEGRIGKVQLLQATFNFILRDKSNVRLTPDLEGGVIQDVGCYCINVARWFLGEPVRVRGLALDLQGVGVDTNSAAVLEHAGGALSVLSCSFETTGVQTVEFIGERGRIVVPTAFVPPEQAPVQIYDRDGEHLELAPPAHSYALEALAVERLIREGTPLPTTGEDALKTQLVVEQWQR
ncbi:MAG TPA: Gfo/Idh/MocA family oxidoreductase [Chloroflexota bacterium]|nr:Gfo/Idh/MocA family oxidoreductase [Chloroflexota bacterium]